MVYRRRSWLAVLIVLGLCLVARSGAAQLDPAKLTLIRGSAPQATTGAATNITTTSATLTGTVNTNGLATTVYFQWGTTTAYDKTTVLQSIGNGTRTGSVSAIVSALLTGLTPSSTYHYRVVASNAAGTTLGADMTFTTPAGVPPSATTGAATNVTATSATLTGTVNRNGRATTAYFQWGTTTAYGKTTASQALGSGWRPVRVSVPLTGLTPSSMYHYRVVASNGAGTTPGADMTFTTSSPGLTQISEDASTNTTSQHATQVEPHVFAHGDTIVAAFQSGRFFNGGASNISFATSQDGGATWVTGNLPGITKIDGPGPYDRVSDPAVAFDARHNVWLISSLALSEWFGGVNGAAVLVSRSTDGGLTWQPPVTVAAAAGGSNFDKNWIVCDNTPTSPFYGNCYTQFDDFGDGARIKMSTSTDGGLTWGAPQNTANNAAGVGGQSVVQPNGTVIVPIANAFETAILAFMSTDGGQSWGSTQWVAQVTDHTVAGGLRTGPLPSAAVDDGGKVYVVWQDCRFRSGCTSNDVVMSTSTDGITWSAPVRIPIDAATSGVDHFIPGLAADTSTSGGSAYLGLTYYFYPVAACSAATCQLKVGFVSSADGGATWSAPVDLAGPMALSWLPQTNQGRMVGDYIATTFNASGRAYGVFAVAHVPTSGGTDCATATPHCDQAMHTPESGLSVGARLAEVTSVDTQPAPHATSDHAAPQAVSHRR